MRPPPLLARFCTQLPPLIDCRAAAAARVCDGRPPRRSMSRGARRPPPLRSPPPGRHSTRPSNHRQPKPTGISYLDTWMGTPNADRRVGPVASSPGQRAPMDTRLSALQSPHPHHVTPAPSGVAPTQQVSTMSMQIEGLPSSAYQMYTLRPSMTDTPDSLLGRLDGQISEQHNETNDDNNITTIPLVLDLSAFRPDGSPHFSTAEEGALSRYVDAILSHQVAGESQISYCLVGVTNLPPDDRSMVDEARLLNLPIFQSNDGPSLDRIPSNASTTPKRKKRGGVAPLLRQRRPGVAASTRTVKDDGSESTLTTNDEASSEESASDVQIVGMGKLDPHNQTSGGAKVHKGSIRSGQLLSSDEPNQSLVIIGSVNPGGEVWSEGDVYVFGKLRGRVLAGLSNVGGSVDDSKGIDGDSKSSHREGASGETKPEQPLDDEAEPKSTGRIFATSFDPELVCISDVFTTVDDVSESCGLDGVGPAMVTLDQCGEKLLFERIEV